MLRGKAELVKYLPCNERALSADGDGVDRGCGGGCGSATAGGKGAARFFKLPMLSVTFPRYYQYYLDVVPTLTQYYSTKHKILLNMLNVFNRLHI